MPAEARCQANRGINAVGFSKLTKYCDSFRFLKLFCVYFYWEGTPCASLSVPAEESKGWSATIFYLLYSLIGKPKLILQIKNKPLTVSLLHFQSRPRGSKLHYILGRIYARIYPLDIGCLSCYNMCSGYIASSLKCYHFRTCEGGKPPFNPPFQRAERLIM